LVDVDCVLDNGEVDERDLEDVIGKVAFEDALSGRVLVSVHIRIDIEYNIP
jgi:hypothetical protein